MFRCVTGKPPITRRACQAGRQHIVDCHSVLLMGMLRDEEGKLGFGLVGPVGRAELLGTRGQRLRVRSVGGLCSTPLGLDRRLLDHLFILLLVSHPTTIKNALEATMLTRTTPKTVAQGKKCPARVECKPWVRFVTMGYTALPASLESSDSVNKLLSSSQRSRSLPS